MIQKTNPVKKKPGFIKSILATTDLSKNGNRAIPFAATMVPPGGKLCVLHVVEEPADPGPLYAHYNPIPFRSAREKEQIKNRIAATLNKLVSPTFRRKKATLSIQISGATHPDKVAPAIIKAARKSGADLICMSSHGRTGLAAMMLGSVAQKVFKDSRLPVLIIPMRG